MWLVQQEVRKNITEIISDKILAYQGLTEKQLYEKFLVNPKAKGKNSTLIRKIIGLTGDIDKTQEFQKANMNLRVIRIDKNGLPKKTPHSRLIIFKSWYLMIIGKNLNLIRRYVVNDFYL